MKRQTQSPTKTTGMTSGIETPVAATERHLAMVDATSLFMREGDDAMLERGVGDSCSTGQTPVMAPISSPPSPKEAFSLLPPSSDSWTNDRSSRTMMSAAMSPEPFSLGPQNPSHEQPSAPVKRPPIQSAAISKEPSGKDPASIKGVSYSISEGRDARRSQSNGDVGSKRYLYRKCLSGHVRPKSGILPASQKKDHPQSSTTSNQANPQADGDFGVSPVSVVETSDQNGQSGVGQGVEVVACATLGEKPKVETRSANSSFEGNAMTSLGRFLQRGNDLASNRSNDTATNSLLRKDNRSNSIDRRLNEACQFAEALGELPPRLVTDVPEIIDEGGSDYDDDSDAEVVTVTDAVSAALGDDATIVSIRSLDSHGAMTVASGSIGNAANMSITAGSLHEELVAADEALKKGTPIPTRPKVRPIWPFQKHRASKIPVFLHRLPDGENPRQPPDYVYKGICANPPEITFRGVSRGNYAQLHRKAWLEVSDKYHRYGKNLRLYYKYWEKLGFPTNQFFDWLDSKGEAAGQPLPNLPECPRAQLDSDTVLYITNPEVTATYALRILVNKEDGRGLILDVDGDPVVTGAEGWIFVLRDGVMYGAQKITSVEGQSKERFHHSSFFCGKAVAAAGILITDENGYLMRLYPHSGHYRPGEADIQRMLLYLHHHGISLLTFEMDTQQILHVSRHNDPNANAVGDAKDGGAEKKKKKVESLHLRPAVFVACFLAHKARFIRKGVFDQIHRIRKANVTSASEALDEVDQGGIRKRIRRETYLVYE